MIYKKQDRFILQRTPFDSLKYSIFDVIKIEMNQYQLKSYWKRWLNDIDTKVFQKMKPQK